MKHIQPLKHLPLSHVETLAFAGGGNRCWWQSGAISRLLLEGWRLPKQLVGTSAGAAVATSFIIGRSKAALDACIDLYSINKRIFDWSGLARLKMQFAHQQIYPAWIESFLNADTFTSLRNSSTRLRVAVTRPSRLLGLTGSVAIGTLAYVVDKWLWHSIHPRLPRFSGLRQDFIDLHLCKGVKEAQALLGAAAAAPPFMSSVSVGNALAIDGGYTDNAPIHQQSRDERLKTLVLLTRHYPHLPLLFRWRDRVYWQPSQRVPVSTWDCTARTTVRDAFLLGNLDASRAFSGGSLGVV